MANSSLAKQPAETQKVWRKGPIKVLVVDASPLVRSILARALAIDDDIEVVATAVNTREARREVIARHPEVIVLDMHLPRGDSLAFLKKLRLHYPVPVIMCSRANHDTQAETLAAVEHVALDVAVKPPGNASAAMQEFAGRLIPRIRTAAGSAPSAPPKLHIRRRKPESFRQAGLDPSRYVIAVGASTGGTDAIRRLLSRCGPDFPPIVMVQHMPIGFTGSFAQRLNQLCAPQVSQAVDGDQLTPGRALLARGDVQMRIGGVGAGRIRYGETNLFNRHCPSVDVLFHSVAEHAGRSAIGVLLTGMGDDGAAGLLAMRNAGALTIAQDHLSCIVYGMPKAAVDREAALLQAAPADIPRLIIQTLAHQVTIANA